MRVNFIRPQKAFSAVKQPPLPPAVRAAAEAKAQAIAQAAAQAKAAAEQNQSSSRCQRIYMQRGYFFKLFWKHCNGIPEHWFRDINSKKPLGLRTAGDAIRLNQSGRQY